VAAPPIPAPAVQARRRGLSQRQVEGLLGLLFVSPYILHFVFLQAGAIVFSFALSFFETDLLTGFQFLDIDNYRYLFTEEPLFTKALVNTAI